MNVSRAGMVFLKKGKKGIVRDVSWGESVDYIKGVEGKKLGDYFLK